MRPLLTLLCVWPAVGVSTARAQTDYYARLGVTFATDLVTDNIVQDIVTQQSLAPTLAFGRLISDRSRVHGRAGNRAVLLRVPQH